MDLKLRHAAPADYRQTEWITREAFWNQYAPGCVEHYLLHIMRGSPAFVHELDLAAFLGEELVGSVVFVRGTIQGDDGRDHPVLTLGPISVLPRHQGRGVGGALITHAKVLAREQGFGAILLCGDPDYYSRHGFVPAESLGIRQADGMYAAALQACELYDGALAGASGRYCEDSVYQVDEGEAEAFDRTFPPKEKVSGTRGQKRLLELAAMVRPGEGPGLGQPSHSGRSCP